MSYATKLKKAAKEAQSVCAQMQGMAAGGTNALINGATYVGVYGAAQVIDDLNGAGGYKRRTVLALTLTRAQFIAAPASKTRVTRTDISPTVLYLIDAVNLNDPLVYVLALEKVG